MSFALGVNLPWVRCGHDFGPRPPAWSGAPRTDWAAVESQLRGLADLGLRVVRVWVLAGGVNLPVGARPQTVAERVPFLEPWPAWQRPLVRRRPALPERWAWRDPVTLPRAFLDDFEALLRAATRAGVRLVPSLVSFELFFPIRDDGGVSRRGHGALALSPGFFDATLEPLLELTSAHPGAVEAFEVANEPGWAVRRGGRGKAFGPHPPWVRPEAMGALLVDGARRIAARGLRATIGFTDATVPWLPPSDRVALARLAASGRYVHQLHHYPRPGPTATLPPASHSPIRPCWVGEMATSRARRWLDPDADEDAPTRFLARRLELVRERGYDGALLWSANATDAQTAWSPTVRAQVARVAGVDPAG